MVDGQLAMRRDDEVVLRDMAESDIEDYVRWFTTETEWNDFDSPWAPIDSDEKSERASWAEYFQKVKTLPRDTVRWKYEIEVEGKHVGWVCSYKDLEYLSNGAGTPALGIDIPEEGFRGRGYGTKALVLYMDYLRRNGRPSFFIQTWSGNSPMIRIIGKLGFKERLRKKDCRLVNGRR
jgi:RimJ/RimL family protein N-acetyltransferase